MAPSGTIATRLNVKVTAGIWFVYLITKPAGTIGRSRIISQLVKGAPFALAQSLLELVRDTSKSLTTQDPDSTKDRLARFEIRFA